MVEVENVRNVVEVDALSVEPVEMTVKVVQQSKDEHFMIKEIEVGLMG